MINSGLETTISGLHMVIVKPSITNCVLVAVFVAIVAVFSVTVAVLFAIVAVNSETQAILVVVEIIISVFEAIISG